MPSPDLIIFDCDGVLVDSEIIAARVDAALLTEAGYPVDAADVAERFSGLPFREILTVACRQIGPAQDLGRPLLHRRGLEHLEQLRVQDPARPPRARSPRAR